MGPGSQRMQSPATAPETSAASVNPNRKRSTNTPSASGDFRPLSSTSSVSPVDSRKVRIAVASQRVQSTPSAPLVSVVSLNPNSQRRTSTPSESGAVVPSPSTSSTASAPRPN